MNLLRKLLTDPEWILSVLIAGFLVNLVSAYAKDGLSTASGRFSKMARQKKARREAAVVRAARALNGKLEERLYLHHLVLRLRSRSNLAMLAICACAMMGTLAAIGSYWGFGVFAFGLVPAYGLYRDLRAAEFIEEILERSLWQSSFWTEANFAAPRGLPSEALVVKSTQDSGNSVTGS